MAASKSARDLLFVYGTLMSDAGGRLGADMRARLKRAATVLGPAMLAGARLHDLGRYPGLVETGRAEDVVHGELIRLRVPAESLPWLDAYEGLPPGHTRSGEYERAEREVFLQTATIPATPLWAWVYLYRADVSHAPTIPGGRWRANS